MLNWPPRLNLARLPTPLERLERYSARFAGTDIWIKHDEQTGMEVSGNKIRKLEFSIAQAREEGCDTLITCGGVQSNHCRATAILGARLGMKVHLMLRGESPDTADGNLLLDRLSGAAIDFVPAREWSGHPQLARDLQDSYRQAGNRAFYIPIGASDEIGLWGYVAACEELRRDFDRLAIEPDYIVVATGSGGTQGGLIAGRELFSLTARIKAVAVCDDAAWFEHKIRQDLLAWRRRYGVELAVEALPIDTLEGYVGPGYGVAGPEVFETIGELAREEGVILDPVYTGKAFHGMVNELARAAAGEESSLPDAKVVVFVHTGGLFGLFPHRQSLRM